MHTLKVSDGMGFKRIILNKNDRILIQVSRIFFSEGPD